jgi:putative ABC transport system ATP-binding protein
MSLLLKAIRKDYSQGTEKIPVLQGLEAEIQKGEVVAVVGQSGSGKSTLLSLLAGLDQPSSGSIQLNGISLSSFNPDALNRWRGKNIGIVFQQYHLLQHLTALENVSLPLEILGLPTDVSEKILRDLGLGHRVHHLPRQLSGGECQRVAIARALAPEPSLLLADEPSGNLDQDTGEKVMEAFFQQVRKHRTTTVLVTHNRELARRCDRQLSLEGGRFREL